MANGFIDSTLLDKAIGFAVRAHHNTERRGKGFPYIVHPLEAVSIVATLTSDQELLAAAALHDVVEDTDFTLADLRASFGERIAWLVEMESDKKIEGRSESESWRSRKQAAIDRLAAAPYEAKLVAMGDKLSNMRAIARDYDDLGDALWERFHAPGGRADHEWHYRGLAQSLNDLAGTHAYTEFVGLIEHVFGRPRPEWIDLDDYRESGDGYTATSYNHKDGKRMMKLYADNIPLSEAERELEMSWNIMSLGIRIPKAYRLVTDGKRVGVEFERIIGKRSFARVISEEPGKLAYYATLFAKECRKLHATPCDPERFISVKAYYHGVVDASPDFDERQKNRIHGILDQLPEAETCIHGDMHIGNIITDGALIWWIDLADFRYGHPLFDLAMMHFVCVANEQDEITQQLFHLSHAQMLQVWEAFVPAYFGPGTSLEEAGRLCAPYTALRMIALANREEMVPHWRTFIENTLLN